MCKNIKSYINWKQLHHTPAPIFYTLNVEALALVATLKELLSLTIEIRLLVDDLGEG